MKLKRLSNKDDESWRDWPALRRAIEESAIHFGQKSIGVLLDRLLAGFVVEDNPAVPPEQRGTTAVWYAVDDAGTIVGHLVALEDQWDGAKVIYINQLWAPNLPRAITDMALEELDHYARSRNCRRIFMYTRRDCPKFWKDKFGFERYRVLYSREVT